MNISIGEAARRAGCKVQTLRYYEARGLLPRPARTAGNRRIYGAEHVRRLAFIRHARELGFSLAAVRELLALGDAPDQLCARADEIASARLAEVTRKIASLAALRKELARMIRRCRDRGPRSRVADCRVIEALADHSHRHCLSAAHGAPEARFGHDEG